MNSIKVRLINLILFLLCSFLFIFIVINYSKNKDFYYSKIYQLNTTLIESLSYSIENGLNENNLIVLNKIMSDACANPDILRCKLFKKDNLVIDIVTGKSTNYDILLKEITHKGHHLGRLEFYSKKYSIFEFLNSFGILLVILTVMLFVISIISIKMFFGKFIDELLLFEKVLNPEQHEIKDFSNVPVSTELIPFFIKIKDLLRKREEVELVRIESIQLKKINESNKQIAHDIRSPLEALKSITTNLDSLDFNTKRIISNSIGRISDIANGLLKSGNEKNEGKNLGNLRILLDDIVHDKSFEHNIDIKYEAKAEYRNSYILGNENTLYRSLSNLVNNAVEAQSNSDIYIRISLTENDEELMVTIEDHGPGMDEALIEKVLVGGHTTKDKGNGLGLSYAKAITEDHGGHLLVKSELGKGSKIELVFPKDKTPAWFVDEFLIDKSIKNIICVDDDLSFLDLYKEKLKQTQKEVLTFTNLNFELDKRKEDSQFFFDYDLGKDRTGLDFIVENNLTKCSTLITSMHQDESIQKKCVELGIKMMPKQIFNNANVKFVEREVASSNGEEVVFIDDDRLMHMSWKMEADRSGVDLKTFFSIEEFLKVENSFSRDVKIFIDSNLGDGIKGEIESEKLSQLGFKNLFLATGYSPDDIEKPSWIIDIVGKRADFKKF